MTSSDPSTDAAARLFPEIVGHERIKTSLVRAAGSGRLHHALLFAGRAGVGKSLVASRLAQILICEQTVVGEGTAALHACNACPNCRRVVQDLHPDVTHVRPKGRSILIAQVRELQQKVAFAPFEARLRVIVLHAADSMLAAASNAMLKTLEEPTDRTVFILLSDAMHRLLPTIVSRSQPLRFAPFRPDEIEAFLVEREVAQDRAAVVSLLAEGSFGRALELAGEELDEQLELVDALHRLEIRDPAPILQIAGALGRDRDGRATNLALLRAWFRDLLLVRSSATERVGFRSRLDDLRKEAARYDADGLHRCIELLSDVEAALEGYVNPTLCFEHLLLGLVGARAAGADGATPHATGARR